MSLLIATPLSPPDIGGPATHCKLIERLLSERSVTHTVVSFREVRQLKPVIRHLVYTWRLFRATKRADRVYALDASSVGLPALLASRLRGIPCTVRIAGITAWEIGTEKGIVHVLLDAFLAQPQIYPFSIRLRLRIEQFVLRRTERIIVPSEYFKRVILLLGGIAEEKIEVVYSGFTPTHEANVLTESREQGLIVSAGRLKPWKGFATLIEAVMRMREQFQTIHLVIIGNGEQRAELEHQITELEADAYITLVGSLAPEEIEGYLSRARIFALNTGYEGFSHQLLEVMDAGVPIVTTPAGGNAELFTHGKDALLVPYNDVSALIEALSDLLVDAKLAQSLSYNAYRKVREFSNEKNAERLVRILTV